MQNILLTQEHCGFRPDVIEIKLIGCGLNREHAKAFRRQFRDWFACSGIEWTVNRIKTAKQIFLDRWAGKLDTPPWFKTTKVEKLPAGVFELLRSYKRSIQVRCLNIYKVFQYSKNYASSTQVDKFVSAVTSVGVVPVLDRAKQLVRLGMPKAFREILESTDVPKLAHLPRSVENGVYYSFLSKANRVWDLSEILRDVYSMASMTSVLDDFPRLKKALEPIEVSNQLLAYPDCDSSDVHKLPSYGDKSVVSKEFLIPSREPKARICDMDDEDDETPIVFYNKKVNPITKFPMGSIAGIQEPGLKLRAVAVPYLLYQAGLEPLKVSLLDALKSIEEDCTHDQMKGVRDCQDQLRLGKTVYSVDLSNATDRFPFDLQLEWLNLTKCSKESIRLLTAVATGSYSVPTSLVKAGFPDSIKWSIGQPLGSGPSFPLFALTNHFLVRGICLSLCKPFCYRIVGDDIVIFDKDVAECYQHMVQLLGCKIAADKSIASNTVAEFCSVVITPKECLVSTKMKRLTQSNVVDYGKAFDRSLRSEIAVKQSQSLLDLYDVFCSIPPEMGGIGIRDGRSLDKKFESPMVQKAAELLNPIPEAEVKMSVVDLARDELIKAGIQAPSGWIDSNYGTRQVDSYETPGQKAVQQEFIDQLDQLKKTSYVPEVFSMSPMGPYCNIGNRKEYGNNSGATIEGRKGRSHFRRGTHDTVSEKITSSPFQVVRDFFKIIWRP